MDARRRKSNQKLPQLAFGPSLVSAADPGAEADGDLHAPLRPQAVDVRTLPASLFRRFSVLYDFIPHGEPPDLR
jgi:hypothetical protein